MRLTDTLEEQQLLESLIETVKPPVPPIARGLNYLLSTPFRYDAPYPVGSRFRRAGMSLGVYYAAERVETAIAETAFYRVLFLAESPGTPPPANGWEMTAFAARCSVEQAVDLTKGRLADHHEWWSHPTDYARCQQLADDARGIGIELIRYRSVRDPSGGANVAVLTPTALDLPEPIIRQSWHMFISGKSVRTWCESPVVRIEFPHDTFGDPRLG